MLLRLTTTRPVSPAPARDPAVDSTCAPAAQRGRWTPTISDLVLRSPDDTTAATAAPLDAPSGAGARKDAILEAVAVTAERLLGGDDWQARVDDVLRVLGAATRVDRVYIFEVRREDGLLLASQRHEWCGPGVEPQLDNPALQDVPFVEAGFGRWEQLLASGQAVYGDVADFPRSEQELLTDQGIVSLVVVPIRVQGRWWGFVGFDATRQTHRWAPAEVDALRASAGVLGAAIGQQRLVEELERSRTRYLEAYRREREAADRLRDLDRLRDTFLDAVSHELRTPLHTVIGASETLQAHTDRLTPERRAHLVDRLVANGHRLERLLSQLLDLNRLRTASLEVHREAVQLDELLRAAVRVCDPVSTLDVHVDAPQDTADLDPLLAERILVNLLENAAVHAGADCQVWVRARSLASDVRLTVADDGPGVPPAHREEIVAPFSHGTVRQPHAPGTGMGLAIVRQFAELHGGRAWYEDRAGGGAAFHVELATSG